MQGNEGHVTGVFSYDIVNCWVVLSGTGQLHREFVFFSYCNHCLENNEEEYKGILKERTKLENLICV